MITWHRLLVAWSVLLWGLADPASAFQVASDKPEVAQKLQEYCENANWKDAQQLLLSLNVDDVEDYWLTLARFRLLNGELDEAVKIAEANELPVKDAWVHAGIGFAYAEKSRSKCKQHLITSLSIEPELSVAQYAVTFATDINDPSFAAQSLLKLFKRHPVYMAGYSADLGLPVDEKELSHGRKQVELISRDRPALGRLISESDRLQEWLATRFSGVFIGQLTSWNPNYTDENVEYDGCLRVSTKSGKLEISVNPAISVEDQLATLVLQLLKAENSTQTNELFESALNCEITKESFVRENTRLDHRAMLKQKAFFAIEYPLGGVPRPVGSMSRWSLRVPNDFDRFYPEATSSLALRYEAAFDKLSNVGCEATDAAP